MKLLLVLITLLFFQTFSAFAQEDSSEETSPIDGCSDVYSSLVFVENNQDILTETRSDQLIYPASLVKLMTLYLTFEALEKKQLYPYQELTFSGRGEEISKVNKINTLKIVEGDTITVREAIRAVIVKSMNEAAVILAEAVSGSEWAFARKMNQKAKKLGMINSSFRNSSGLHEEGQYTTVYDLARLAKAIKRDFPDYYHLFSLKEFSFNGRKFYTHNHVLNEYNGAEGLKTGFTNASGFNLIAAARKGGKRVISILAACSSYQDRDEYTKVLLDRAFENLKNKKPKIQVRLKNIYDYMKKKGYKNDERDIRFGAKVVFTQ